VNAYVCPHNWKLGSGHCDVCAGTAHAFRSDINPRIGARICAAVGGVSSVGAPIPGSGPRSSELLEDGELADVAELALDVDDAGVDVLAGSGIWYGFAPDDTDTGSVRLDTSG
jgi:hypothetical protein